MSKVKHEVAKLYPLYGHVEIGRPVSLSINVNKRVPHYVNPSSEPQTLLTVSGICAIKMVWTLSVGEIDSDAGDAIGVCGIV